MYFFELIQTSSNRRSCSSAMSSAEGIISMLPLFGTPRRVTSTIFCIFGARRFGCVIMSKENIQQTDCIPCHALRDSGTSTSLRGMASAPWEDQDSQGANEEYSNHKK